MSVRYLLDGYNIIHQMPALLEKNLQEQRAGLVSFIERCQPQGKAANTVTIVFDGQPGIAGVPLSATVAVLFSAYQSADEKIEQMVEDAEHPKDMIVITNDRAIGYRVRASGARVMPVREFLAKTKRPAGGSVGTAGTKRTTDQGAAQKNIPKSVEYAINQECMDRWVQKRPG